MLIDFIKIDVNLSSRQLIEQTTKGTAMIDRLAMFAHDAAPRTKRTNYPEPFAARVDGRLKVIGQARYAAEYPVANVAHAYLVSSAISKGRITESTSVTGHWLRFT